MPEYRTIIQRSVNFIENNLLKKLDMEDIADYSGFSLYHFMRIFSTFTGYTLKEYIRERRLSEAAKTLLSSKDRISELAGNYCFDSSESFIRAFKKQFNVTPSKYRKRNQLMNYTPKLKVQIYFKKYGGKKVEFKIKEMPELRLIGLKSKVSHGDGSINSLWSELKRKLLNNKDLENLPKIALCKPDPRFIDTAPKPEDKFDYFVGVLTNKLQNIPQDLILYKVKSAKYAIFTHKGSLESIGETYRFISCEWIQNVDYQWALAEELEWYDYRYGPDEYDGSSLDLYIPISE